MDKNQRKKSKKQIQTNTLEAIKEIGTSTSKSLKEDLIEKIKNKGYKVSETHFSNNGLRTNIPLNKLIKIL